MAGCFPNSFVNFQQRPTATRAAVDQYDAPAVDIQCGTEFFYFISGGRNELRSDRHCYPFDAPGRNATGCERLQRFIGSDKVSIDVWGTPSPPEWRERI